jgi:hypothetical protein
MAWSVPVLSGTHQHRSCIVLPLGEIEHLPLHLVMPVGRLNHPDIGALLQISAQNASGGMESAIAGYNVCGATAIVGINHFQSC